MAELNNLATAGLPLNLPAAAAGLHHIPHPHHHHHHLSGHPQLQQTPPTFKSEQHGVGKHRVAAEPPVGGGGGGILAARLAKMVEPPMQQMFSDFQEHLAIAAASRAAVAAGLVAPPPMKRPRKAPLPPLTSSPIKGVGGDVTTNGGVNMGAVGGGGLKQEISVKKDLLAKNSRMSPKVSNIMAPSPVIVHSTTATTTATPSPTATAGGPSPSISNNNNNNNNYESDSDVLKIDEDRDNNKENNSSTTAMMMMMRDEEDGEVDEEDDDDIAELENENGLDESEEEAISHKELAERAGTNKLLNF